MNKKEYNREYYLKNKAKLIERQKQYYEGNKEVISEKRKKRRKDFSEETKQKDKESYQKNKEQKLLHKKEIRSTPIGRANNILGIYRQSDNQHNRGECTLTAQWIVDNIFTQPCFYCGETGWEIMGCDRIDNDKPHTPDNVVPCCCDCNKKRGTMEFNQFIKSIKNE